MGSPKNEDTYSAPEQLLCSYSDRRSRSIQRCSMLCHYCLALHPRCTAHSCMVSESALLVSAGKIEFVYGVSHGPESATKKESTAPKGNILSCVTFTRNVDFTIL